MRVLDDDQDRRPARDRLDAPGQSLHRLPPPLGRGEVQLGIAAVVRQRQHLGDKRGVLGGGGGQREQRVELVELRLGVLSAREPGATDQVADDRIERAVRVLGRAEIAQPRVPLVCQPVEKRGREPRLADARFAREQNDLALSFLGLGPAAHEKPDLLLAAHKRGEPARVKGVEPARLRALAHHRPDAHRPAGALELLRPELIELEQVAQQFPGVLGDDDAVRLGDSLQARGAIRRLADDGRLARIPRSEKIADDHDPGRDAHSHVQRSLRCGLQLRRRFRDRKPRPHRALGVVFVRLGIAEIGEHAVAHVAGDEAAVRRDQGRAALLIGRDDLVHVLGIEPGGKRGRADEIDEHHR